jgi:hypothetical protein
MQHKDPTTNQTRGYVVLTRSFVNSTLVFLLRTNEDGWYKLADFVHKFRGELKRRLLRCEGMYVLYTPIDRLIG